MNRAAFNHQSAILRGVSPMLKLACALALSAGITLLPRTVHRAYTIPAGILLIGWLVTRMPLKYALRRLLFAEFFIGGLAVLSILVPSSAPFYLAAFIKSNLCVLCMILLTWTTPFFQILGAMRRLGVPDLIVSTMALMARYLPVLRAEARRIERARMSRTFSPGRAAIWRNLGQVIGQVFLRGTERAERVYLAMCARGWK